MTTTPDPVDALKYILTVVAYRLETVEHLDDVITTVDLAAKPFTDNKTLDELRYSDGSYVTVNSEYAPGRFLTNHYPPPGSPAGNQGDEQVTR